MPEQASDGGPKRVNIVLVCSECQARNYKTTKRPQDEVALRKFCKTCKCHTTHRESK